MGYWYVAPGVATAGGYNSFTIHMGGGGEFAIAKGISAGIEGGALGFKRDYTGTVVGTASANGYYHFFKAKDAKFDPFVTGGYTLFFRSGTANLGNFGAGVNYWFTRTLATRVEFRDHVWSGNGTMHYWGIRMGLSFTSFQP